MLWPDGMLLRLKFLKITIRSFDSGELCANLYLPDKHNKLVWTNCFIFTLFQFCLRSNDQLVPEVTTSISRIQSHTSIAFGVYCFDSISLAHRIGRSNCLRTSPPTNSQHWFQHVQRWEAANLTDKSTAFVAIYTQNVNLNHLTRIFPTTTIDFLS